MQDDDDRLLSRGTQLGQQPLQAFTLTPEIAERIAR